MMEYELSRPSYVKFEKCLRKANSERNYPLSTMISISDDTCLEEIEDGLTETARMQIKSNVSTIMEKSPQFKTEPMISLQTDSCGLFKLSFYTSFESCLPRSL